jgi:hypothetical protein
MAPAHVRKLSAVSYLFTSHTKDFRVAIAYRFYVIGDHDRILANELETFAADGDAVDHAAAFFAKVSDAKAVEIWDRARLINRIERN